MSTDLARYAVPVAQRHVTYLDATGDPALLRCARKSAMG